MGANSDAGRHGRYRNHIVFSMRMVPTAIVAVLRGTSIHILVLEEYRQAVPCTGVYKILRVSVRRGKYQFGSIGLLNQATGGNIRCAALKQFCTPSDFTRSAKTNPGGWNSGVQQPFVIEAASRWRSMPRFPRVNSCPMTYCCQSEALSQAACFVRASQRASSRVRSRPVWHQ